MTRFLPPDGLWIHRNKLHDCRLVRPLDKETSLLSVPHSLSYLTRQKTKILRLKLCRSSMLSISPRKSRLSLLHLDHFKSQDSSPTQESIKVPLFISRPECNGPTTRPWSIQIHRWAVGGRVILINSNPPTCPDIRTGRNVILAPYGGQFSPRCQLSQ